MLLFSASRVIYIQMISVLLNGISIIFAKLAISAFLLWQFLIVYAISVLIISLPFLRWSDVYSLFKSYFGCLAITAGMFGTILFYTGLEELDPATHSLIIRSYIIFGFLKSPIGDRQIPRL